MFCGAGIFNWVEQHMPDKFTVLRLLHYPSNKISATYEFQRILVSRFPPGAKLSEHFAKKNERRRARQRGGAHQPSLPAGGRVAAEAAAIKFVHK